MNIPYTDYIDMSNSEVFDHGFLDKDTGQVYLVFNNGTTVSRYVGSIDPSIVESWGRYWHGTLRWASGENLGTGNTFEARAADLEIDDGPAATEFVGDGERSLLTVQVTFNRDDVVEVLNGLTVNLSDLTTSAIDGLSNLLDSLRGDNR